jgi:hypothetical protein
MRGSGNQARETRRCDTDDHDHHHYHRRHDRELVFCNTASILAALLLVMIGAVMLKGVFRAQFSAGGALSAG